MKTLHQPQLDQIPLQKSKHLISEQLIGLKKDKFMELIDLKPGDCIKYNFLYSNEEEKIGLITKIKKDNNFAFMIYLVDKRLYA